MEHLSPLFTLPLLAVALVFFSTFPSPSCSAFTQSGSNHPKAHLHSSDLDEITSLLLHHRDDPLAHHDKWSLLSSAQRLKWTTANEVVDPHNFDALLRETKVVRQSSIHVHVDVQIVAPPQVLSPRQLSLIQRYSTAMRAGSNGTLLNFNVSLAPDSIQRGVALHTGGRQLSSSSSLSTFLDQSALALHALNVLYVVVNPSRTTPTKGPSSVPTLGNSRTAYFEYSIPPSSSLSITHLLCAIEQVAERVFAPNSLYFPIPMLPELEVSVIAYTPGHRLRATWLDDFAWDSFETAARSFAVSGQQVRFSSAQTNAECPDCETAFRQTLSESAVNIQQAIKSFSGDNMPNHTWPDIPVAHYRNGYRQTTRNTFRLFVLDTYKLRQSKALQRLERRALFTFPGAAVLVIRTSDHLSRSSLHSFMLHAFVSSVYGIVDPAFYDGIPSSPRLSPPFGVNRISPLLRDSITRNLVQSVVEKHLTQLEEIVDGMLYFKVDPQQALDEIQLSQFNQRVNLLLFKLQRAQLVISDSNDVQLALYLASSAAHDIKSIRAVFDINDEKRVLNRFRDPTIRCHFSRLKRKAILASEIIETTYPTARPWLLSLTTFFLSAAITRGVLWRMSIRKSSRKIE